MRKEVNPVVAFLGILIALTVVQVVYWRGLIGGPPEPRGKRGPTGPTTGDESVAPRGSLDISVTTLAGEPEPGHRDGAADRARFDGPAAIAAGRAGATYIADSRNHCVRALSADGQVETVAGAPGVSGFVDGPAEKALFFAPAGLAVAADGSLLVADTGNHCVRRITPAGLVTTYAGSAAERDDLGRPLGGYRDGPAGDARFCYPVGIAVDRRGFAYVADTGNSGIRCISPTGQVSTLRMNGDEPPEAPTHLAIAPDGRLWVADTAGGALWVGPTDGPLKRWRPQGEDVFASPSGIAAAQFPPTRRAIVVADSKGNCLWQIEGNEVLLLAGELGREAAGWQDGSGETARFASPVGLAAGPKGEVYVADFGNNCLRRVQLGKHSEEVG